MPIIKKTVSRIYDHYPYVQWFEERVWEDDEFEDRKLRVDENKDKHGISGHHFRFSIHT